MANHHFLAVNAVKLGDFPWLCWFTRGFHARLMVLFCFLFLVSMAFVVGSSRT